MKKFLSLLLVILTLVSMCSCGVVQAQNTEEAAETASSEIQTDETVDIQILATSDLHGKFMPWDYLLDSESTSGSMTQLATAIAEKRNENTLVLDAGDIIQDNLADLFIGDEIHPMVSAMNYIGYDAWTTGNHEYNYGVQTLQKIIGTQQAELILCNVYDENGERFGKPYEIFERGGVRIAVVGVVTPNIVVWDAKNLSNCTVTNPVEECRKRLPEISQQADVIIALAHMGLNNEYGTEGSGATELAEACPEFDLIIAAHDHTVVAGEEVNSVYIVENKNQAQTMSEIHLTVKKDSSGCELVGITSEEIDISLYEPDEGLTELLSSYHQRAVDESHVVIGSLEGGNLRPENEITDIPIAQLQDTAMMDLILKVEMYYSGADVVSAALSQLPANLKEGEIRMCDVANIYKYNNTLYSVQMTGAQLKTYMEWSASYYQQYKEGDLTIAFNPSVRYYNYDMFAGVNYEIDVSKPVGERIVNLTWPDGTPVQDDDSFVFATSNYRCSTQLLISGEIFTEDDIPTLLEPDIHCNDIGDVRALIADYISNVCSGVIYPELDNNWKIIGNNWDEALHQKAVEQLNSGIIELPVSADGRAINTTAITEKDLK